MMPPRTPAESFADAAATLVREHDVVDLLLRLTTDAMRFFGGDAAGVLVRADARMEVLRATSHTMTHLELFQAQQDEGPCVDVVESRGQVEAAGRERIVSRWPKVGQAIVDAGFQSVHAFPLKWERGVIGGLNVFGREERHIDDHEKRTAQAFADMITLTVAHPDRVREDEMARRVARALSARVVIEQAKGALAQLLGIDMAAAYEELVARSARDGVPLTAMARQVLWQAQQP